MALPRTARPWTSSSAAALALPAALAAAAVALATPTAAGRPAGIRHARRSRNASNPIVLENEHRGTRRWIDTQSAPIGAIEGYTEPSLAPGETAHFHVSASRSAGYRIRVYRIGWYGGAGGRRLACLPSCTGHETATAQVTPPLDGNGEVRAEWPVSDTLRMPADWVSGYYMAQFVLTSGPYGAGRSDIFHRPGCAGTIVADSRPVVREHRAGVQPLGRQEPVRLQQHGRGAATHVSFDYGLSK